MFRTFEPSEALIEALKKKSGAPNEDKKEKRSDQILANAPKSLEVNTTYTSNQGGLNFRTLAGNKQTENFRQQESHSNLLNQFLTQERKLYGTTVSSAATASTKASSGTKNENRKSRFSRTGQTVVSPIKFDRKEDTLVPPPIPPVPEKNPRASPDITYQRKQRSVAAPTETVHRSQSQNFTGTIPDTNTMTLPTSASSPCLHNLQKSPAIGLRRPSGSQKKMQCLVRAWMRLVPSLIRKNYCPI